MPKNQNPPPTSNDPREEDAKGIQSSEKTRGESQSVNDQFNGGINPTFNMSPTVESTNETSDGTKTNSSQAEKAKHDDTNSSYTNYVGRPYLFVDQRAKVFRSHDKVLWLLFASDLGQGGSSGNSSIDKYLEGSVWDENYNISIGDEFGKNMKKVIPPTGIDGVLLLTKTLDEYLSVHAGNPKNSVIDKKVFWATYYDGASGEFKPITGVCYFEFWHDLDTDVIDLLFWCNVYSNVLNDKSKNIDQIYDGLVGPQMSDCFDTSRPNGPIQRAVFYTKGTYRKVSFSSKKSTNDANGVMKFGMAEESGATIAGMYLFSRPVLLYNPGHTNQDTDFGDPVVDRVPFCDVKFVELK